MKKELAKSIMNPRAPKIEINVKRIKVTDLKKWKPKK